MTRKKFQKLLKKKGYVQVPWYKKDLWEKCGINILIEVRRVTFVKVIRFKNGSMGYVESLYFKQHGGLL